MCMNVYLLCSMQRHMLVWMNIRLTLVNAPTLPISSKRYAFLSTHCIDTDYDFRYRFRLSAKYALQMLHVLPTVTVSGVLTFKKNSIILFYASDIVIVLQHVTITNHTNGKVAVAWMCGKLTRLYVT